MPIILLISAVLILGAGGYSWRRNTYLLQYGKKAQGIIFKNNSVKGVYYPVVRFLTDQQEWITQELNTGSTYPKKEGSKLEVLYDPDDPNQIELYSSIHLRVLPIMLIIVGLILLSIGLIELLGHAV